MNTQAPTFQPISARVASRSEDGVATKARIPTPRPIRMRGRRASVL